jgi:hypothetical protein
LIFYYSFSIIISNFGKVNIIKCKISLEKDKKL